jgi:hypothetical protein
MLEGHEPRPEGSERLTSRTGLSQSSALNDTVTTKGHVFGIFRQQENASPAIAWRPFAAPDFVIARVGGSNQRCAVIQPQRTPLFRRKLPLL